MRSVSSKAVPATVASEENLPFAPTARRTWKTDPAPPVQASFAPAVVAEAESWKPACGGPRAPAAPTKKALVVSAERPAVSVTVTLNPYLPAARAVVRRLVLHVAAPAMASSPPPAGRAGAEGTIGSMRSQSPPPAG